MSRKPIGATKSSETCKQITTLIADYLGGRLTPAVRRGFARHLRICPDCVRFLNTYRKSVKATQAIPIEEIPANVRGHVLDVLRKRLKRTGAMILAAKQLVNWFTTFHL